MTNCNIIIIIINEFHRDASLKENFRAADRLVRESSVTEEDRQMMMMSTTMTATHLFSLCSSGDDPVGHNKSQVRVIDGERVDLFLDGFLERRHHLGRLDGWTDTVERCCAGLTTMLSTLDQ